MLNAGLLLLVFISNAANIATGARNWPETIGVYTLQATGNATARRRQLLGGWTSADLAQPCAPAVLDRSLRALADAARAAPLRVLTDDDATARDARALGLEAVRIDARLIAAAARRAREFSLSAAKAVTLLKLAVVAQTQHDWACFVDLDIVFSARASLARFVADPAAARADLLGCSAGAPFNAGWWCVRPNAADYERLVDLVATASFSAARGWEDAGQ